MFKRRISNRLSILVLCMLVFSSAAGCTNKSENNTAKEGQTTEIESDAKDDSTEADTVNEDKEDANDVTAAATTESSEVDDDTSDSDEISKEEYDAYYDYISPKEKEEVELDDESESLYAGFLAGDVEAMYVKDGDTARHLCMSEVLSDGGYYTLNEIIEKMCDGCEGASDWVYDVISEYYVDLGLDGIYELKADIGAAAYNLSLVVKNIDGHLKICFAGDSWDRSLSFVGYSGDVNISTTDSYKDHNMQMGFIDGNGDYHFWYSLIEEGFNICEGEDLYYNDQHIGTGIGMYVDEISFDKDMSETYYCVYIVDMDNHTIDEDVSDPEDPYKLVRAALEAEGKNLYTKDEIKELEDEHRQEIGFADELYFYGDELYPGSDD